MFNVDGIYCSVPGRFACRYTAPSKQAAEYFVASFLGAVRERCPFAELVPDGCDVILDTPNARDTVQIAGLLNARLAAGFPAC